ncbi:MAG TPA: hypothetical protein VGC18_04965, partial [Lacisediminihabitans sp.]
MTRASSWSRLRDLLLPAAVLCGSLLLWEAAADLLAVPEYLLPAPSRIAAAIAADPQLFVTNALYTLQATVGGFALAVVIGVALAVVIVQFRF